MLALNTTQEVITHLGGRKAIMSLCDATYTQVHHWWAENWFPARHYLLIQSELARRGAVAPPSLWGQVTVESKSA